MHSNRDKTKFTACISTTKKQECLHQILLDKPHKQTNKKTPNPQKLLPCKSQSDICLHQVKSHIYVLDMLFTNTSLRGFFTVGSRVHKLKMVCAVWQRDSFLLDRNRLLDFHAGCLHSPGLAHICLVIDIMHWSCNLLCFSQIHYPFTKMQTVLFLTQLKISKVLTST